MFDIEEILAKADLRALVEKAGGELHGHANRFACACPLHGGDNPTGFSVYNENGKWLWNCFSGDCGGGDAIAFVMKWQHKDFKTACEFLGGDVMSDPQEMTRLAAERAERAKKDLDESIARAEAARKELQQAQRHLFYHEHRGAIGIETWIRRGIPEDLQGYWYLGYCNDFQINDHYHAHTLTIPLFDENRNVLNIKHRILNPQNPKDKYRPERSGLGAFPPFMGCPEIGLQSDMVVVVEGEIKAMVLWSIAGSMDLQVIGVGGKSMFEKMGEKLRGVKNVIVIPDPGSEAEPLKLAQKLNARWLQPPDKIDDYLLGTHANKNFVFSMLKQARRVRV